MNRFYENILIHSYSWGATYPTTIYEGMVFVGVSFRDQKGLTVKSKEQSYEDDVLITLNSTPPSLVSGRETDTSSGWMPLGGPIKGFFLVINGKDSYYDYISNFGVYVQDPCQAVDDITQKISLNPTQTSIKDLKYHAGTDSAFWLNTVCHDEKALRLVDVSAFPFL